MDKKNKKGFSLLSTVITLSVMAVITGIVVTQYSGTSTQSKVLLSKLKEYSNAETIAKMDLGCYPVYTETLFNKKMAEATVCHIKNSANWNGPYIKTEPVDSSHNILMTLFSKDSKLKLIKFNQSYVVAVNNISSDTVNEALKEAKNNKSYIALSNDYTLKIDNSQKLKSLGYIIFNNDDISDDATLVDPQDNVVEKNNATTNNISSIKTTSFINNGGENNEDVMLVVTFNDGSSTKYTNNDVSYANKGGENIDSKNYVGSETENSVDKDGNKILKRTDAYSDGSKVIPIFKNGLISSIEFRDKNNNLQSKLEYNSPIDSKYGYSTSEIRGKTLETFYDSNSNLIYQSYK